MQSWTRNRAGRLLGVLGAALLLAGTGRAEEGSRSAVTEADIEPASCQVLVNGQVAAGEQRSGVLGALGLAQKSPWVGGEASGKGKPDEFLYMAVLRKPLAAGSMLCPSEGEWRVLKADAPVPPDPTKEDQWERVAFASSQGGTRLATFPPGFQARAFLYKDVRHYGRSELRGWRLLKARLHNITPDGLANGESDYVSYADLRPPISYAAAQLTKGTGTWQSHGPDNRGRIARAPVSDIAPSWFVISWDKVQGVCGVYLQDNFRDFKLLAYQGPEGVNPAVGGDQEWTRLQAAAEGGSNGRWLWFPSVTTRGLKFLILKTEQPQYAAIHSLLVFTDLQDKPVPQRQAVEEQPPFKIACRLEQDGIVTLAVDDAQGRRVRNLLAREQRKAGEITVPWDLKDEYGTFVAPGTYRWKAITHPGLTLRYELCPYPNITDNAPQNSPWLNGASGPGGWLADHTPPIAVCPNGERVFLSAPCAESGVALIECDLAGRKLWGHHNLMAWTGPSLLACDGQSLFAAAGGGTDRVWRFELPGKRLDTFLEAPSTPQRQRGIRGMAARDGKLYLAIRGDTNWLTNAAFAEDVDIERCEPKYGAPPKSNDPNAPEYRNDFLRLFRLMGTPPGNSGLHCLETSKESAPRQHIVLAFNRPVPVGSLVFPMPDDPGLHVRLSVLKADAPYPPPPNSEKNWNVFWKGRPGAVRWAKGWTVVPAPENTLTRALRISFDRGMDELDELLETGGAADALQDKGGPGETKQAWRAQIEGLKILRRRFASLLPKARISVSSGQINKAGEWDAQRDKPVTAADPGIYMLEWDAPQTIRGLAIQEVDGKHTEIDAYTGPDGGPADMRDNKQWTKIGAYEQPLRDWYQPGQQYNSNARYVDGYVDFGKEVKARALRLRVVAQWTWREDDRAGCVGVRRDRGGQTLDPTRCRIYGVAPLGYLGGEAPLDPLVAERLEIYDARERKVLKELPLEKGGDLAFNPAGDLYALSGVQVVKVDTATGERKPLIADLQEPRALTFDKAGNLYVFDGSAERRVIRVYDPSGRFTRTIGTPGGRVAGPWDPTRFCSHPGVAVDIAVDGQEQLWVVECDYSPKRVSVWGTDGTFKKDFFGNTSYGGGGVLDPYDKKRLFVGPMEFELDWQTGKTRLKNMTWLGNSPSGEVPIRVQDRTYLVTRPMFGGQSCGVVYLYDKDRLRRVAAVGMAGRFEPLRAPEVLASLGRRPLGDLAFAWTDRNGDGNAQADEVTFFDDPGAVGTFDETLGTSAGAWRYEVKEFLPNGAPVYERRKLPGGRKGDYGVRLSNGNVFCVGSEKADYVFSATGAPVWSYPAGGRGVHALYSAKPWYPAQVVAEFDVVGRAAAHAGDLGEFLVTNTNCGIWHVWTADGLLAGNIFRDMRSLGARPWSMLEHERGLELTDVTAGQEHFSGYFCRVLGDNKYYVVAGHNFAGVAEVVGLEKFKRLQGEVGIAPQDVAAAMDWERKAQQRKTYEGAKIIECRRAPENVKIDGEPKEWGFESARLKDRDVSFTMAYDDRSLYVCCKANGCGPLKNTGNDWHRLFKTGAAVDLHIGVDPAAPLDRSDPAKGDMRILLSVANGQPVAVLYQPNAKGAKPDEAWETHTLVFRAAFERVVRLDGVKMAVQAPGEGQGHAWYCLEAAIPLASIGLKITPGLRLKMDWGVLVSGPDGSEVLQRLYWSNTATAIVADEAAEALLQPGLWGFVRFSSAAGKAGQPEEARPDSMLKRDANVDGLKLEDE
ncbi:MAG: hypothetical protein NTW87_32635 [Planctomycetota bacterium]|nr:hypothetical protein [Planctomycetota bacterium]